MTARSLVGTFLLAFTVTVAGCRRPPPSQPTPERARTENASPSDAEIRGETAVAADVAAREDPVISDRARAIIDSIEAAVADSFAALRGAEAAAIARADSIAEAARQDSLAAAARADSIARAEAVQDSIDAARQDSIRLAEAAVAAAAAAALETARQDSIFEAVRQDSIDAAQADSIAASIRRDSLEAVALADSLRSAEAAAAVGAVAGTASDPEAVEASATDDLETLRELGPSYIPYDQGPETIWDTETQATLSKTLLPVLRAESLPATTKTIFWVLISREGAPVETRIQTASGSEAFDAAARSFLEGLTFLPAIRSNRPVASWVLREISILMQ